MRSAHLARRLVGEGDGQHLIGPGHRGGQVGGAVRDEAGLARSGPGQHQQRPLGMEDGLSLRIGQIHQQVVCEHQIMYR